MTSLTKTIKKHVIRQMVVKAASKKAVAAGIMAENITKELAALIMAVAHAHVPELDVDRWNDLITNGVVVRRMQGIFVETPHGNFPFGLSGSPYATGDDMRDYLIEGVMYEAWPKFMLHVERSTTNVQAYRWNSVLPSLPHIPGTYTVYGADVEVPDTLFQREANRLNDRAYAAMEMFMKTWHEANWLYDELTEIMDGIRTLKQLREQFPDAEKFVLPLLPASAFTVVKKVPTSEQIKAVSKKVMEGIPSS